MGQWSVFPFPYRFSATCFPRVRSLLYPAALFPWRGSGSRCREGWLHAHLAEKGHGSFTLSQGRRVVGDLTGMSLHPGTKHIPVQRFRSFRSHLSFWVKAMGLWQGEIDLLVPGQGMACHAMSIHQLLGGNPGIYTTSSRLGSPGTSEGLSLPSQRARIPLPIGVQH